MFLNKVCKLFMMTMLEWSNLTKLQLSRYGEYYSKMEFSKNGFDIYTSEIDDKGIDFIVRKVGDSPNIYYYEIQVKTIRWPDSKYVFMRKSQFPINKNVFLSLIIIKDGRLFHYLICSDEWNKRAYSFFKDRRYEGKKSKPEWGLNLTQKSLPILDATFRFENTITRL